MDEAVPAPEGLDVGDASHISAIVLVVLKIVLLLEVLGLGGVFEGSGEVLHTFGVRDWVDIDRSRPVDIDEHLLVLLSVVSGSIPDWVHHEVILSGVQSDFLVEKREREVGAEASIDKLTCRCHENDIESGRVELLPGILFAVVHQPISLLEHRDSEGFFVEVNSFIQSEREEGLRHGAFIKRAKAVIELRVLVFVVIFFNADRSPREVLKVVIQLNEENTIVSVDEAAFLLQLRRPERRIVRPVALPFSTTPWVS